MREVRYSVNGSRHTRESSDFTARYATNQVCPICNLPIVPGEMVAFVRYQSGKRCPANDGPKFVSHSECFNGLNDGITA